MSESEKPSYYAIIPAEIRYNQDLPPNAKLMYGEITCLCNKEGFCWASNKYFAKLYNVDKATVSRWINKLAAIGKITSEITYLDDHKTVERRILKLTESSPAIPIDKKVNTPIDENVMGGIDKKVKGNSTSKNNTSDNKKEIKEKEDSSVSDKSKIPPNPEEVTAYAASIGYELDGQKFCDYYGSQGWKKANGCKLADWQMAVRTWKSKYLEQNPPEEKPGLANPPEVYKTIIRHAIEDGDIPPDTDVEAYYQEHVGWRDKKSPT